VATLPEKERTIIEQYYFHDRKFSDIATQSAGLSKSWVSRLHDRALATLKERMETEVPELLDD
jgi:RNA polymerase sigma factor for flagellar operon FliA